MAISVVKKNVEGKVPTWRGFIADTIADLALLPISPAVAMGSECYCSEDGNTYILETDGDWVVKKGSSSGGGSSETLPAVTTEDNGQVLTVVDGEWNKAIPTRLADLVLHAIATPEYGEDDEIIGITVEADMTPAELNDIKNDSDTIVMILNYDDYNTYFLTFDGNTGFDGFVMSNLSASSPSIQGIKVASSEGEWYAEIKTGTIDVTWL